MTTPLPFEPRPFCGDAAEERLNRFLDADLPAADEPALFVHLAGCAACRAQFGALLAFRRVVRQDHPVLPPAADEAFFAALDRRRAPHHASDRAAVRGRARSPLGRRVPLGAALAFAACVLGLGVFAGGRTASVAAGPIASARPIVMVQTVAPDGGVLYVVPQGVEVEALRQ